MKKNIDSLTKICNNLEKKYIILEKKLNEKNFFFQFLKKNKFFEKIFQFYKRNFFILFFTFFFVLIFITIFCCC